MWKHNGACLRSTANLMAKVPKLSELEISLLDYNIKNIT